MAFFSTSESISCSPLKMPETFTSPARVYGFGQNRSQIRAYTRGLAYIHFNAARRRAPATGICSIWGDGYWSKPYSPSVKKKKTLLPPPHTVLLYLSAAVNLRNAGLLEIAHVAE
jgi:hypothetical protein